MYKYKRIHTKTNVAIEEELVVQPETKLFLKIESRKDFLEIVNNWNRLSVLQADVVGSVEWIYVAL